MINLLDYGFIPTMMPEGAGGIPARITAVHKERYGIVCEYGQTYARLKTSVYYGEGNESFPTTGDFVMINYNESGDSQIVEDVVNRRWRLILIMYL